ncbi:MAG: hypothetical protein WBC90_16270 [Albidovulum sp.]
MLDATKVSVINALSEMIADLAPHAYLRPMYGGLVIELEKENPRSRIGGFFTYSEHISLEGIANLSSPLVKFRRSS